jgi:tetratricopeptide (TPR) repeat protein
MQRLAIACSWAGLTLLGVSYTAAEPDETSASPSAPAPATDANRATDERTERANRHFQNGVKLYRDGNYGGALAEFEAAYELKPGASSLQNIALSLKGLFRYAEAADALKSLLLRHEAELSERERQAVRDAISELSSLVGSILLDVSPREARVVLDGRPIEQSELGEEIVLNVGEHTLSAEAPGYARAQRTFRVAGAKSRVPVRLTLKPTHGFVTIVASDREAAIAIDQEAKSYHRYTGPLSPGYHLIQVYKPGFEPFEKRINVELGKATQIAAALGPPTEDEDEEQAQESESVAGSPGAKKTMRGWYGLVALSILTLDDAPRTLNIDNVDTRGGGSIGVRAGYRIFTPVAVELLLDGGRHELKEACLDDSNNPCDGSNDVLADYRLDSARVGGNVRYMSSGRRLRFSSTLGVGAVRHKVQIDSPQNNPEIQPIREAGIDPYFMAEVGAQYNLGHILLELNLVAFIDGASNIGGNLFSTGLPMLGLGLRGGWSEWKP